MPTKNMTITLDADDLFGTMRTNITTSCDHMNTYCTKTKEENKKENVIQVPRVKDYKIINNKVVIVTFEDGTKEKAVCDDRDTFDLERALEVIIMKKRLGSEYNQLINKIVKECKQIDKDIADKEKFKKEQEEITARHKAKMEKRKAKRLAKEREARIEEQKEAYVRALVMMNNLEAFNENEVEIEVVDGSELENVTN